MADRSYKLTLSLSDGSTINAGTITAPQGPNGANGANGATFTPSVSAAGVLSWTNNGGLTNPPPISIKGPKGDDAVITASDVENWGFTKNKGTVTSVAVKINGTIKGTVTSSGTIDLGTVLTEHQDISGKANLSGGNTFTGKQTLNSPASDGYSINAEGYVKGSWLRASAIANKGANTGKVCVFDNSGWIYYRTPAEILTEAGGVKASDIPDVSGKANLSGGNSWTGNQQFNNGNYYFATASNRYLTVEDEDGNAYISMNSVGFNLDADGLGNTQFMIDGNAGTSGQVFTSKGAGERPIWSYVTKHGYTQLTNEDLDTIMETGWYYAAANNTCTHNPGAMEKDAFILIVEKEDANNVKQTYYKAVNGYDAFSTFYVRTVLTDGTSGWLPMKFVHDSNQAFSGTKTFLDGINIKNPFRVGNSSGTYSAGTTGQVLTSQGENNTPIWTKPAIKSATLSGTTLTITL